MTQVPDYVPMLVKGVSEDPKEGGCLVQIANWLVDPSSWTDDPECVHPLIAQYGIWINDGVDDEMRHRLALQAPRIAGTRILDPIFSETVENELDLWLVHNEPPFRFEPLQTTWLGSGKQQKMEVSLPHLVFTGTSEAAVEWFERFVEEFHHLRGTEPEDIPAERWLEVKEHVGQ